MSGTHGRLIQANTTLLQPGSGYFRLVDAFAALQQLHNQLQLQTTTTAAGQQTQINTLTASQVTSNQQILSLSQRVTTLESTVQSLQAQIDTINQRLATAGIP